MPSTTNFGWTTPADTDLVKDGASAIRTLGNGIDTSFVDLKGGTTGQVLSKNSNTDLDFTWVAQDDSNAIQNALLTTTGDTIYASGASTPARLGIGTNGQVLTVAGGVPSWATPASGATSWTNRTGTLSSYFNKIEYNGSNLYVGVGGSGQLYTSGNGTTWTSRTSGFGSNVIYDVAFGNGLWVAVGDNGTITTSTDGTTWTARTSNMGTNGIYAVRYANSIWVAVGTGGGTANTGGIIYSTDGITWTRKSQSITVGTDYYDVSYNGTNWIVGANNSTNNYLYASTPSGTWTAGQSGSSDTIYRIFWDGTRNITVETNSRIIRYSTSATLGTTTAYLNTPRTSASQNQGFYYLYNNVLYVTNGVYWQTVTPATSTSVIMTAPQVVPTRLDSGTPFLQQFSSAIFAGASGLIYGTSTGIWTSF